jgi:GntR family transcriptional regulator
MNDQRNDQMMGGVALVKYVGPGEVDVTTPEWEYAYLNVAKHIVTRVMTSRLKPGQRLPNGEALAKHRGVSSQTQQRAMRFMRKYGLVVTIHGKGTFIAPHVQESVIRQVSELIGGEMDAAWR